VNVPSCAKREQNGGTFHFGNVPGLALTILGIDTCPFFDLFSSSHYHSWPNKPNASKVRQKEKRCESNEFSRDLKERLQAVKGEGSSSGRGTSTPLLSASSSGCVKSVPNKGQSICRRRILLCLSIHSYIAQAFGAVKCHSATKYRR
jgi:hypothetical protein